MPTTIRCSTFETNSSSTHSLVIMDVAAEAAWETGDYFLFAMDGRGEDDVLNSAYSREFPNFEVSVDDGFSQILEDLGTFHQVHILADNESPSDFDYTDALLIPRERLDEALATWDSTKWMVKDDRFHPDDFMGEYFPMEGIFAPEMEYLRIVKWKEDGSGTWWKFDCRT